MLRSVLHMLGIAVSVCGVAMFIGCTAAAQQYLDPDRSLDDKLTTWFFPMAARKSDYVGRGWSLRLLAYVGVVVWFVGVLLFVGTSAP